MLADADIADVAAAIANPARGRMLDALLGGRALPARGPRPDRALGAAVLDAMMTRGWLVHRPQSRTPTATANGRRRLVERLGVDAAMVPPVRPT